MSKHATESGDVTFVVPAYNAASFIGETLASITNQSVADWRCIVVDDGSSDQTVAIVSEYCSRDGRFELRIQANRGGSAARNSGAVGVTSQFIVFLDHDDILAPDFIQTLRTVLEESPELAAAYGNAQFIGADSKPIREGVLEQWSRGRAGTTGSAGIVGPSTLDDGPFIMTPGQMLIRTRSHQQTGGFKDELMLGSDWDYELRLAESGPIAFLDTPILKYRRHSQNGSVGQTRAAGLDHTYVRCASVARAASRHERVRRLTAQRAFYHELARGRMHPGRRAAAARAAALSCIYFEPLWRVARITTGRLIDYKYRRFIKAHGNG